jgi:hypothetical protein
MTRDETSHSQNTGAEMPHTIDPMKTLATQIGDLAEDGYRRRRDADLARIVAGARESVGAHRKVTRVRRRPLLVLAGTAAAAVAVAAIAVPAVRSGHSDAPPHPVPPRALDAKSFLLASADISEKAPLTAHGSYWYSQIRTVERARKPGKGPGDRHGSSANGAPRSGPYFPFRAYVSTTWENWDPYQQGEPSRMVDRDIKDTFATPADKAAWQRAGSPSLSDMKPFSADSRYNEPYLELGPKGTKMADLPNLPVTPAGLEKLIRADRDRRLRQLRKAHAASQELPYTEDVYQAALGIITAPTTPKVRAAAYRMLAGQRGIRSLGEVRDGLGRPGVALVIRLHQQTRWGPQSGEEHLIIDPASANVIAEEYYPIGKGGKAASDPSTSTLMISDGWTDRIGAPARS